MSMEGSTLQAIYKELRYMNERLDFMEDLVEEVIIRELPKAKVSRKALSEIKKAIAEMRSGERIKLEELTSA